MPDEPIDLTLTEFTHDSTAQFISSDEDLDINLQKKQAYELVEKLGEGAMGEVYLVRDFLLRRKVAYKQLLEVRVETDEVIQRFMNEAQITAQLEHPYIIPVYSFEQTPKGMGYTMKRIKGKTLKDVVNETKSNPKTHTLRQRLDIFLKVCSAMSFSHSRKIIHRDLKPDNVMIGDFNEVYILDWGIARPFGDAAKYYHFENEEKGKVIGTLRYLSPEQARAMNPQLDQRSDLFSLALILYDLLCLRPAYMGKGQALVFDKVLKVKIEPISPELPRELKAILTKALQIKRDKRYQTVNELALDIHRYLQEQEVLAQPDNFPQKSVRWFKRHRTVTYGLILLLIIISASFSIFQLYKRQTTLAMAQKHEQLLNDFLMDVKKQGKVMDFNLLNTKISLQKIAGAAVQNLKYGQVNDKPYYIDDIHFNSSVPDLQSSRHYGQKVSVNWTASSLAYTIKESDVKEQLKKMSPLRHFFKSLFLDLIPEATLESQIKQLTEIGVPLHFAHITTKEGIIQYYPGTSYITPNYDPRLRPFYTLVNGKRGVYCGNPILDKVGGKLLACSLAIYDENDTFLGVSAIDLQFNYLAKHFLELKHPSVTETYLLDGQGRLVLKASDQHEKIKRRNKVHSGYKLRLFKEEAVLNEVKKGHTSGYIEINKKLYVYLRLNFLNWVYLVEANPEKVFK